MPATISITTVPAIAVAADRPARIAESPRVSRPGKAIAVPMRIPAAPDRMIAKSSVEPWMMIHPAKSTPSPRLTNTAISAPSVSPL